MNWSIQEGEAVGRGDNGGISTLTTAEEEGGRRKEEGGEVGKLCMGERGMVDVPKSLTAAWEVEVDVKTPLLWVITTASEQ